MGFKCGIIGLPNVGKSTLFNALTQSSVPAENYPFCTIEPNVGVVAVADSRLAELSQLAHSRKTIPTTLEFIDIAGLVKGASKGEGLGNKFLSHVRSTQAVAQVVRCFAGDSMPVAGKVAPLSDIETINTELLLADLEIVERALQRLAKHTKSGEHRELLPKKQALEYLYAQLSEGKSLRSLDLDKAQISSVRELDLLSRKPMMLIANISEQDLHANPYRLQLEQYAQAHGLVVVEVCAKFEAELASLSDEERLEFLQEAGLQQSGLDRISQTGYRLLDLLTFFTAGPKETRAWTVAQGATAAQAAGCIHSDFEKGFIRAEVIAYDDYIRCGGEQQAKEAGKWCLEGKDYVVQEGDVVHFRFSV